MAADVRTSHAICRRPYAAANGRRRSHEGAANGIRVPACAAGNCATTRFKPLIPLRFPCNCYWHTPHPA